MDRISWKSTSGLAFAAMVCLMAAPASAGIIYTVTNDTAHQNGWSAAGTITVSGTGTFADESAITAWDITVTKVGETSHRYSNTLADSSVLGAGSIVATSNSLFLGGGSRLQFFATADQDSSQFRWTNNFSQSVYTGKWQGSDLWLSSGDSANVFIPSVGGVWTLASGGTPTAVPEIDPAGMGSVFALVTGALGLLERRRLKAA